MRGKNIIFDDKKDQQELIKKLFSMHGIEIDKVLISKKDSCGNKNSFKYFLGYNDDDVIVIRPLCIKLPQMIGYFKHFDSNKTMFFKVNDNRLLKLAF